jgi:hypothetical protein
MICRRKPSLTAAIPMWTTGESQCDRLYYYLKFGVPILTYVWEKRRLRTNLGNRIARRFVFSALKYKTLIQTITLRLLTLRFGVLTGK